MRRLFASIAVSLALASPSYAQGYAFEFSQHFKATPQLVFNGSVTASAVEMGWWDNYSGIYGNNNDPDGQDNHVAGKESIFNFRNYFVFTLPTGFDITSATLRLNAYTVVGNPVYTLYDYLGKIDDLLGPFNINDGTVFDDLGSGASFGSHAFLDSESDQMLDIAFNASAIASLNASRGLEWAVGGSVDAAALPTVVPEPASVLLLGAGLAVLLFAVRTKRCV